DRNLTDMRFPVQYVLRPNPDFRGFSGTIASGILRTGQEVVALPSGKRSRIKSIVTYEGELAEAFAPMAVTVTLEDEIDISRGDMLVYPGQLPNQSSSIEAMVVWMGEKPFVSGKSYWIKHTTRLVTGEIADLAYAVDVNTLEKHPVHQLTMNEVGNVKLSLNQPLAYDAYKTNPATGAFIIIDRLTNNTVGAGMILEPQNRSGGDHWAQEPAGKLLKTRLGQVSLAEREQRFGHRGVTILLTGLTGSGKATIAYALEKRLFDAGCAVTVLYGQNMRTGLCRDLGFSADDRSENLRRSSEVAKILNDSGLICIAAFVAPHEPVRRKARDVIGADRFVEIFLSAPLEICRQRDRSGAFTLADTGQITQFPGVSAAFEEPTSPDLLLRTDQLSVDQCVERIVALLNEKGFLANR
ncbi:MAG TPA: adenylyl-sulfate kinase, partial [Tepidisphaeraceae bacterium]|nr:adenylyl-sulfate kinase [Tepidisphaeraceae bacterium]